MYCSGCGTKVSEGLIYCNRCGLRITPDETVPAPLASEFAKAVGYVGPIGFFSYIFVVFVFVRSGAPTNQLIPITLFYFGALFGICALLIRQASGGRFTPPRRSSDLPASEEPAYLKPPNTAQLEEGRQQPVGSVTDHTTRTLDEIRVERKQ